MAAEFYRVLRDVLLRISTHPADRIDELLPVAGIRQNRPCLARAHGGRLRASGDTCQQFSVGRFCCDVQVLVGIDWRARVCVDCANCMRNKAVLAQAVFLMGCAGALAGPSVRRDDPQSCVDAPLWRGEFHPGQAEPLKRAVAGLGECARTLSQSVNVRALLLMAPDGSTELVSIRRASTEDCEAIQCVRRHLMQVKVEGGPGRRYTIGIDFTLNDQPKLDTNKWVEWEPNSDRRRCVDGPLPGAPTMAEAVFAPIKTEIGKCYDAGRARDSDMRGHLQIRGTINAGRLEGATVVENQLTDCAVVSCIRQAVEQGKWPTDPPTIPLTLNLLFDPSTSPKAPDFFR